MDTRFLATLALIPLVHWMVFQNSTGQAKRDGAKLVFKPRTSIEVLLTLGMLFFTVVLVWSIWNREKWWVSATFAGFIPLDLLAWPATIVCSSQGVASRQLLLGKKCIPWSELKAVQKYENPTVYILVAGCKITHTSMHDGAFQFENQVKRHFHLPFERCKYPNSV